MIEIQLDGQKVEIAEGSMVMHAADKAGTYIPHFCYHKKLSIAANCRMCLVDVEKAPKPMPACATPVTQGMVVRTKSEKALKAQQSVMEFLLINHPLDCPICDQGGECQLQDLAVGYGASASRYDEDKRVVFPKDVGPLISMNEMNRCIHCTRCVRFITEVAGVSDLGATGRGEDMEITSYLEKAMGSELQANVVDLCPVGALTSKPYEFHARPWELSKTESIDVMDAVGSAIRVDARGREVMRILPRLNEAVNEEWISDKTRHVADGLKTQRLDQPFLRVNGKLKPASWSEAFAAIAAKVKGSSPARMGAIAGDLAGVEEMFALKGLMTSLGSPHLDCRQDGAALDPVMGRASYVFNPGISGIDEADAILMIGTNIRKEAPIINARIRKRWLKGDLLVGVIGEKVDLTYEYNHLGNGPESLAELVKNHSAISKKKPIVIVGQGALARPDGAAILSLAAKFATQIGAVSVGWNGFAVLHTAAARVGGLDLGLVPGAGGLDANDMAKAGALDVLFNLGADEIDIAPGAFTVYVGTHGDKGAMRADVILPGAAYTEKSATYVNTEGRAQMTSRAGFPPGEAREDWAIIRALSTQLGHTLPFDTLGALRKALYAAYPGFAALDSIAKSDSASLSNLAAVGGKLGKAGFVSAIDDFYLTNPVTRASAILAECSALAAGRVAEAAE